MVVSKSLEAVRLIREQGLSVIEAADRVGITRSAVYARLNHEKEKDVCPHCGQIIPAGHKMPKKK